MHQLRNRAKKVGAPSEFRLTCRERNRMLRCVGQGGPLVKKALAGFPPVTALTRRSRNPANSRNISFVRCGEDVATQHSFSQQQRRAGPRFTRKFSANTEVKIGEADTRKRVRVHRRIVKVPGPSSGELTPGPARRLLKHTANPDWVPMQKTTGSGFLRTDSSAELGFSRSNANQDHL